MDYEPEEQAHWKNGDVPDTEEISEAIDQNKISGFTILGAEASRGKSSGVKSMVAEWL
jgi:hypothetical protein